MISDPILALPPVLAALDRLGIPYQIGESLAAMAWSRPRTTRDADLLVDLQPAQVAPLVAALAADYYIDDLAIYDAIRHRASFNILHLATMFKIDFFIRNPAAPFDTATFQRARAAHLDDPPTIPAVFTSPEDIVLRKLVWYQMGGGVSDRQWLDILEVLQTQGPDLDRPYMRQWESRICWRKQRVPPRPMPNRGIPPPPCKEV